MKKAVQAGDIVTEIAVFGLWKIPAVASAALIAAAFGSCGSLSMCFAAAFYFIKVRFDDN